MFFWQETNKLVLSLHKSYQLHYNKSSGNTFGCVADSIAPSHWSCSSAFWKDLNEPTQQIANLCSWYIADLHLIHYEVTMQPPTVRDASYMQICDHICDHIFRQNPHIAYLSVYNDIFKIAHMKIMLHMLHVKKFAYISTNVAYFRICDRIFSAFFLSNVVLRPLNIFGG